MTDSSKISINAVTVGPECFSKTCTCSPYEVESWWHPNGLLILFRSNNNDRPKVRISEC